MRPGVSVIASPGYVANDLRRLFLRRPSQDHQQWVNKSFQGNKIHKSLMETAHSQIF